MHVALIGDSILDNRAYTKGEPDVATHLRHVLGEAPSVTLCAIDGSRTSDLGMQLSRIPADSTHIVVSIGGNDALMNIDLLNIPVTSTGKALSLFGERIRKFEQAYKAAIDSVLRLGRETAICTIYNGNLDEPEASRARIVLMLFNDVILRCGFERHLAIVDLRFVCSDPADYANPIEPSGRGGLKIAKAIARSLQNGQSRVAKVHTG
jgi:hypothetical protein